MSDPIEDGNAYRAGQADQRPWGSWEVLAAAGRFAVKRLTVRPGASLSLQRHRGRDEHWVVVAGHAQVTLDAQIRAVAANEAVFIPAGTVHRLTNPGGSDLVVIEVQYGPLLHEDDIERLADDHHRL